MCPISSKAHARPLSRNLLARLPPARLVSVWAVGQLFLSPALSAGPATHSRAAGSMITGRPSPLSLRSLKLAVCLLHHVLLSPEEKTVVKTASLTHAQAGSSLMHCGAHYAIAWRPHTHLYSNNIKKELLATTYGVKYFMQEVG